MTDNNSEVGKDKIQFQDVKEEITQFFSILIVKNK